MLVKILALLKKKQGVSHSRRAMLKILLKAKCLRLIGLTNLNGKEIAMPMVGKKKYPYTTKGKAKAKAAAKRTGKKIKKAKGY